MQSCRPLKLYFSRIPHRRKMDILPVNFKILAFCGAWREYEDKRLAVQLLHFCYKYTIVILIYRFTILEVIELILTDDIKDLTEVLFMTLTYVALCFKFGNFLLRKGEVLLLLDCFRIRLCQSRNAEENMILQKYDRKARFCALSFLTLSQATGIAIVAAPLVEMKYNKRALPLKYYMPYSTSELIPYLLTYLEQSAAMMYGVLLNVAFDSLVYGCTIHICGQIELLRYRLTEVFDGGVDKGDRGTRSIGECVQHHVLIHKLVKKMESLFMWAVTALFLFSMITLCTSIFQMSKKNFNAEFLSLILYLGSMLSQIFFYCWYGNELQLKSKNIGDAIYASDWINATVPERKSLLIIMTASHKGLIISYYGIFAMALHTFTWILKTSYSAFNVLQQVSD